MSDRIEAIIADTYGEVYDLAAREDADEAAEAAERGIRAALAEEATSHVKPAEALSVVESVGTTLGDILARVTKIQRRLESQQTGTPATGYRGPATRTPAKTKTPATVRKTARKK